MPLRGSFAAMPLRSYDAALPLLTPYTCSHMLPRQCRCASVRPSVRLSFHPSIRPSVHPSIRPSVYVCAAMPLNAAKQFVKIRSRHCRFIENAAMPQACAKGCGIVAHTCGGIAASRNQLAALPRDRTYVGRVAACSGIAATHTTCTHVRDNHAYTKTFSKAQRQRVHHNTSR